MTMFVRTSQYCLWEVLVVIRYLLHMLGLYTHRRLTRTAERQLPRLGDHKERPGVSHSHRLYQVSVGHCRTVRLGTVGASSGVYIESRSLLTGLGSDASRFGVSVNCRVQYRVSIEPRGRVEDTEVIYRKEVRLCGCTVLSVYIELWYDGWCICCMCMALYCGSVVTLY